jgi:hypothetical protein
MLDRELNEPRPSRIPAPGSCCFGSDCLYRRRATSSLRRCLFDIVRALSAACKDCPAISCISAPGFLHPDSCTIVELIGIISAVRCLCSASAAIPGNGARPDIPMTSGAVDRRLCLCARRAAGVAHFNSLRIAKAPRVLAPPPSKQAAPLTFANYVYFRFPPPGESSRISFRESACPKANGTETGIPSGKLPLSTHRFL